MASRPKHATPRPAPQLYLATPALADAGAFAPALEAALNATGAAAVLLRLAGGDERSRINLVKALAPAIQGHGAAVLIEGCPELVARSGADGAHLSDLDAFTAACDTLKPDRIAGVGGLPTRHDAMVAAESGADYVMFGDTEAGLDATLERVSWWAELFEVPCVAFAQGADEIEPLVGAGADFVALDFIWHDPRGVAGALADAVSRLKLPEFAS
jgi:thiamine-phosphate pyrophosphorylase